MRKPLNLEEARRRRQAKIRQKKQRQALIIFLVAAFVLGLGVASLAIINSSFWQIKKIKVAGGKKVSRQLIIKKLNISKGQNLLKLPVGELKASLLQEPYIEEANIYRLLPNTLLVRLKERKAFANIKQKFAYVVIDKNGFALERKKEAQTNLPVITDLHLNVKVGQRVKSKALVKILAVLTHLSKDLKQKVAWVSLPAPRRITFHTSDNLEIVYGDASDFEKKNFALSRILKETGKGKLIYVNVAIPKLPVVKRIKP